MKGAPFLFYFVQNLMVVFAKIMNSCFDIIIDSILNLGWGF